MLIRYFRISFFYIILFINTGFFIFSRDININFSSSFDEHFNELKEIFKDKILVEKILFNTDFSINLKELKYLINITENSYLSFDQLKEALLNLRKKNKFDSLILKIEDGAKGKILTFNFKGIWTFSKVKLKGSLIGKVRYQQYYIIEPGEPFELNKHKFSIQKILKELSNHGYLSANIIDTLEYDEKTKTVAVQLELKDTDLFAIKDIVIKLVTKDNKDIDNNKVLQDKIYNILKKHLVNAYFSKSEVTKQVQVIKSVLGQKGYINPKIKFTLDIDKENKKVIINCLITLSAKKEFDFFGNHFFNSKELIEEFLIDNSTLLVPQSVLAQDITELYKKKGFWNIQVNYKEEPEKYFFIIKEGPRAKVKKINLIGFKLEENIIEEIFGEFLKQEYYDAEVLKQDLEKLTLKFLKEGYWDFNIEKQEFIPMDKEKSIYEFLLNVNPGKQKILSSIEVIGADDFKDLPVQSMKFEKPKVFDYSLVNEYKEMLLKYFQDNGYLFTQIKTEFKEEESGIKFLLRVVLNSGQIKFGKTIITGNTKVKPSIILRQLQYNSGEIWDKEKIDKTIKRFRTLNIFESVSLVPYDFTGPEENKDLVLKLVDDDPYEVRTRIGFQQFNKSFAHIPSFTYRLGGSFLWKNPSSRADQLRLDGDLTRFTGNFALSYQVPYMGSLPINTLTKFYSEHYSQPVNATSNHKLYTERHEGFVATFKNYDETYQGNFTTGFEFMKLSGISKRLTHTIDFEPDLIDRYIPYFYFEPSFIIDKFDNKLDPVKGFFTLISIKGKFPFNVSNAYFVKFLFEQSVIWPIYRSLIGAARIRVGHIFNPKFNKIMPTDRFYLGGATTLRGYEPDLAPPLNSFKCDNCSSWVPVGGKTMFNLNTELRFPIYKNLSGVIFNDMGLLAQDKLSDINANKLLGDTGFGVRYLTPIGPIRFDIGFKWKKRRPDDKRYAWFLTLGHAF